MSLKRKLAVAAGLLLVLVLIRVGAKRSPMDLARSLVVAVSLAGGGMWFFKRRATVGSEVAPRLSVVSAQTLAKGCQAALVEADGKTFLVVFGNGFAQVADTSVAASPVSVPAARRRPFSLSPASRVRS